MATPEKPQGSRLNYPQQSADGSVRHIEIRNILHKKTGFHDVVVGESALYGNVLFIDGELQLSSSDEEIYHRNLVEPPLIVAKSFYKRGVDVLILGGGDGFALRRILSHTSVHSVTLVDHDPDIVRLFSGGELAKYFDTQASFGDPRVRVIFRDAYEFVRRHRKRKWDIVVVDLTDDWLDRADSLLGPLSRVESGEGIIISLNAGSGTSPMWRHRKKLVSSGLQPVAAWSFDMPSFGEPWTVMCLISNDRQLDRRLERDLPRDGCTWMFGVG